MFPVPHRALGYVHAQAHHARRRLVDQAGQGTVEYVALILLVALVMAGVIAGLNGWKSDESEGLAQAIVGKIKEAVEKTEF